MEVETNDINDVVSNTPATTITKRNLTAIAADILSHKQKKIRTTRQTNAK